MNGDVMRYDFGALDGLADSVDGRVKAIETRLSDLQNKINNVTTIWEGAANEGFRDTKARWEAAAADLNAVLAKIAIAVKQTNADAQQTENVNRGRW
jgi:early secretory antigenic target protein ESAT-6